MAEQKKRQTASDLQQFLKARGVPFSNLRKCELEELCKKAMAIGLAIDPEGRVEDREEIFSEKLADGPIRLINPGMDSHMGILTSAFFPNFLFSTSAAICCRITFPSPVSETISVQKRAR
jgi:hypothetical protein